MKKLDISLIKRAFDKEGYTLLSDVYVNSKSKLKYRCPNGHQHSISWNGWTNGSRCPYCKKLGKPTINDVEKSFRNEGCKLISTKYINAKSPLVYKCVNGHITTTTWSNWTNKNRPRRCIYCAGLNKKTVHDIRNTIKQTGYDLINTSYINAKSKLHLVCPNGHDYYVSWDNWYTKHNRCPSCQAVGISRSELRLRDFITTVIDEKLVFNDRCIIEPYELDVFIPSRKLALEYCGLYWHADLFKDSFYHLNKLNLCLEKGIRLVTIFEDEILSNECIVKSRLLNILESDNSTIIYARKCVIKEIDYLIAKKFCIDNHLQGYVPSSIRLGAFYGDELVSVMTFSKPSISKGGIKEAGVFELTRFCSKCGYRVVGIASKLLKYFERNYDFNYIFSYADRRWSNGNLYRKLGFELVGTTKPNYWYFSNRTRRIHRFNLRKLNTDPADITEFELRTAQGYYRIWDCGNLKFMRFRDG